MIYIHLVEENYDVAIGDYYLDDGYFTGTIYDGNNQIRFRLIHTSSPNWGSYQYGYYDYGYAKQNTGFTRSGADSVKVEKPVRIFRNN